jgi:hypothetical protein
MNCICLKDCQVRLPDGYVRYYYKNDIDDFEKCPRHFREIRDNSAIDFDTITIDELKKRDFKLSELKQYIYDKYGIKAGNRKEEKTIELLADCRYREI